MRKIFCGRREPQIRLLKLCFTFECKNGHYFTITDRSVQSMYRYYTVSYTIYEHSWKCLNWSSCSILVTFRSIRVISCHRQSMSFCAPRSMPHSFKSCLKSTVTRDTFLNVPFYSGVFFCLYYEYVCKTGTCVHFSSWTNRNIRIITALEPPGRVGRNGWGEGSCWPHDRTSISGRKWMDGRMDRWIRGSPTTWSKAHVNTR